MRNSVLEGLEMDVRSLGLDAFLQHEVDEADESGPGWPAW
jgi:hypothetical protein